MEATSYQLKEVKIHAPAIREEGDTIISVSYTHLPAEAKVAEVMDGHYVSTTTSADQEAVAKLFMKYDLRGMPVTDNDQRLVGVITVDDVMDVVVQEQTEDMQKMAAMTPSELPYLEQNIWHLSKHRIGWLMILMVTATITGGIISSYEDVLSQTVALAIFIPCLLYTSQLFFQILKVKSSFSL